MCSEWFKEYAWESMPPSEKTDYIKVEIKKETEEKEEQKNNA